jgi:uncharacterized protein YdeI (YjbR/CyaY-like superfamily)
MIGNHKVPYDLERFLPKHKDEPILAFETPKQWEAWLSKDGAGSTGLWLRIYKKGAATKSVSYAEALDGALCHGWIDAQKDKLDAESWLQRFCPRKPKGNWSKVNVGHAERLIKEKRMKAAGLAAVAAAKKDGRWNAAYDSPSQHQVPADLLAALTKDKKALAFLAGLNRANTYAIAYRLQTAKKPETRAKRFALIVGMLKRGEAFH